MVRSQNQSILNVDMQSQEKSLKSIPKERKCQHAYLFDWLLAWYLPHRIVCSSSRKRPKACKQASIRSPSSSMFYSSLLGFTRKAQRYWLPNFCRRYQNVFPNLPMALYPIANSPALSQPSSPRFVWTQKQALPAASLHHIQRRLQLNFEKVETTVKLVETTSLKYIKIAPSPGPA